MKQPFELELDTFTIVSCVIIIAAFVWAWVFIKRTSNENLSKRQKWINQLPSIISTLGVLGTFVGITKGLIHFDTQKLDESIPSLLNGLKTAFFTSLAGMVGSLILNRVVSSKFDKVPGLSDSEKAAKMIIEAMDSYKKALPDILDGTNTITALKGDLEQLKDDVEEIKGILQEKGSLKSDVAKDVTELRALAATSTASISTMDNNIEEISRHVKDIRDKVETIEDSISGE